MAASAFSALKEQLRGVSVLLDGRRLRATKSVGTHLELQISVVGLDSPITIEVASVRWVREREFGVEFIRVLPGQRARLCQVIQRLERGPTQVEEEDIRWF